MNFTANDLLKELKKKRKDQTAKPSIPAVSQPASEKEDIAPVKEDSKESNKEKKTFGEKLLEFISSAGNSIGRAQYYSNGGEYTDNTAKQLSEKLEKQKKEDEKTGRTWFKESESDNALKTVGGTALDVGANAAAGIIESGESVLDALLSLAPIVAKAQYYSSGGGYNVKADKAFETMNKAQTEAFAEFVAKDILNPSEILNLEELNKNSVLGQKSTALAQSAGQLAVQMGLNAIPGVGTGLAMGYMGGSAFGSEMQNALNSGATYNEAAFSSLISAGAELATEQLGGIKFGGKTLGDTVTKSVANRISSKVVRTLAKLGIDAMGEGTEEIISGVVSNLASKAYSDESIKDLLFSEQALDEYIESFIGGAVLGGVASGGGIAVSNITGIDSTTGLNKNETAVVDAVIAKQVADAQKGGKALTVKQKADIRENTMKALDEGSLDISTIEETLGGEAYTNYKTAAESKQALLDEYAELGKVKDSEATIEQKERRAELKRQIEKATKYSLDETLKTKLREEVWGKVQGTRLEETFSERARRGEDFAFDESTVDKKYQDTYRRAAESGILNNTKQTHKFVDFIARISSDKGIAFDFTNNAKLKESGFAVEGKAVNGFVSADGSTIGINVESPKALNSIVGHEVAHILEGTELYEPFAKLMEDFATTKGEYQTRYDSLAKLYEGVEGYEGDTAEIEAKIKKEVVADLVGDYLFTDSKFVERLFNTDRTVFEKIFDEIKYLYKTVTAGTPEAKKLEQVKHTFEQMYRQEGQNSPAENNIETIADGVVAPTYSLTSWNETNTEKLKQDLISATGRTSTEVDKWVSDVNSVAAMIAMDKGRLDYEADRHHTMVKPNQDYYFTLDASTLCAKRLLYQGTYNAIARELGNQPILDEDTIRIRNLLAEYGKETPCAICYVESRRKPLGRYAKAWLDSYDGEYKPTLDEVVTTDGLAKLRKEHPQTAEDFIKAMKAKGTANPKVVETRTDYRGEIRKLTPKQIENITRIGGFRIQSFSDFESPHLIDMMQAVMDMSAMNLTAQAYTKVPNFALAFGDTGIKINLSLIANGVDENGVLILDPIEGMPIEEATRIRDMYSENVGTIVVVRNDAELKAALNDDRIDFIIPFHRSGWSMAQTTALGMVGAHDYTSQQNERDIITQKTMPSNLYPADYWDYNKTGVENAETYLQMCYDQGRIPKFASLLDRNADGSYSLKADGSTDGYWKLLIDFKMYDNNGVGAPQQVVRPEFNMDEARRILNEYEGDANTLPVAQEVVDKFLEGKRAGQYSLSDGTFDKRGKGYIGKSMSVNASEAYAGGQRPMSKWTKADIIEEVNFLAENDVDLSKLTLSELQSNFLSYSSWHHTGAFYNATNFYEINQEVAEGITQKDVDDIIAKRNKYPPKTAEQIEKEAINKSALKEAQDIYYKLNLIYHSDITGLKSVKPLVKRYIQGKDVDSLYNEAIDIIYADYATTVEQWSRLPDDHWRQEYVGLYNTDKEAFVRKVTNDLRTSNNGDIQLIKNQLLRDSKSYSLSNSDLSSLPGNFSDANRKATQFEIISQSNPATDSYHTWIRSVEDIKTFEETLSDEDWSDGSDFDPDYTWDMAQKALASGEITVYSSYPIEAGVFVTPSAMEAKSYSGNGRIYSKTVKISDVAWIDPTQGMFAQVEDGVRHSLGSDLSPTEYGDYNVYGSEIALPGAIQDVATTNAPVVAQPTAEQPSTNDIVERYLAGENIEGIARTHVKDIPEKRQNRSISALRRELLDRGSVFEDLSLKTGNRELQGKWQRMLSSQSRAQTYIGKGKDGVKSIKSLNDEIKASGKEATFDDYMYHRLNADRMSLESRFPGMENKPVFGEQMTAEASTAIADRLLAENPEFESWANDVYALNRQMVEMSVDKGLISQETADLWAKMYPHFVPIHRVGKNSNAVNVPLDTRRTGVNTPFKKAQGGNSDIDYLLDTMASRADQIFRAIDRNSFGVELMNTIGTTIEVLPAGDLESILESTTDDALLQKGKNGQNPTFTVFKDGEKITFEITQDMYDALKPSSETLRNISENPISKAFRTASGFHRGILTEYNPVFMLTNAIKDAQDILMNSQHPARTYANIGVAVREMANNGKYYQEYIENGGDQNTYFDRDSKTLVDEDGILKKLIGLPFNAISKANNAIEMTPRLAEYIASRKSGRSIDVSMLDAARVTTNFLAGGDFTKFLNRNGATFLNASVQGFNQQVRNVREAKASGLKGWLGLVAKTAVAGVPALILNGWLWDDDEEYAELSDYVKQNYYVVAKTENGEFVRIPKGRTVAVIQNAFEQVSNLITGNDEADFETFFELAISNLAPNNPIENNIIAPFVQVANNETWYGEDLVPTRLQDLPSAEQYDESTDAFSKWIGETFNVSPYKVNYLIDQYSGGLGDVFLPMATPEAERGDDSLLGNLFAPLKSKFTTDPIMNNQNVSDFYDMLDELTPKAKSAKATDDDILANKYMSAVSSELSKLYQEKRIIQNMDIPDSQKYQMVKDIQRQIVDKTREALEEYDDIEYMQYADTQYAEIGGKMYKNTDEGWEKVNATAIQKQEEVSEALGITAEQYWSNQAEYNYAYANPELYQIARAVGGYEDFTTYTSVLGNITAGDDTKNQRFAYIDSLDIQDEQKWILKKRYYSSYKEHDADIKRYVNSLKNLSTAEKRMLLEKLKIE